jgi:nucleoside-diphosphate-sugar epimerase
VNKSKIAVLGRGFLGREFERMGYTVFGRDGFSFREDQDMGILDGFNAIVNCIGISDTRYCEDRSNFSEVMSVNADLPAMLSTYCYVTGKKFIHISTGCLYGDSYSVPCDEDHPISAHCTYTVSKYAGEMWCNPETDIIIRPRLLFGEELVSGRNNLIQKLMRFKKFLDLPNSVTWTRTIVEAVQALLDNDASGIFNVSNRGFHTIQDIAKMAGIDGGSMSQQELWAEQGIHLVSNFMSTKKLEEYYVPPTVEDAIAECMKKIKEKI